MLASSHKPFAFKILPINLYSSKILAGFIAQIFDSTRPGGRGGISFNRVFESVCAPETFTAEISSAGKEVCRRNLPSFARVDRRVACPYVGRGDYFVEATTSSCWLRTRRWSGSW